MRFLPDYILIGIILYLAVRLLYLKWKYNIFEKKTFKTLIVFIFVEILNWLLYKYL